MASTNPAVYRLSIALIVFVLLTFILTISTYLFFSQYVKEQQTAKEARDALAQKQEEVGRATDEVKRLRDVIGADAAAKVEAIESDLAALYQSDFNGVAKEPMSYARLVAAVRDEFRAINQARKDVEAAKEAQKKTADDAVAAANKARDDAEKAKVAVEGERDQDRSKWEEDWKQHETQLSERRKEAEDAEGKARRLQALIARIRDAENRVDVEKRADFRAKEPEEQLDILLDSLLTSTRTALRNQSERVQELEAELLDTLVSLGVSNDRVRELRANKVKGPDNVVDKVDGRIVDVDATDRTVTILFPTVSRIREGLAFMVFQRGAVNPLVTDQKGLVRVTAIEGSLVRARILDEQIDDPIAPSDWVASRLWDADEAPEVAVIGFVDLNRDGVEDREAFESLLRRSGATIGTTVTPTTTIVVDAGFPSGSVAAGVRDTLPQIESRRKKELEQADLYGHRVIAVDEALRLLGANASASGR
jgi:hypothetical protein